MCGCSAVSRSQALIRSALSRCSTSSACLRPPFLFFTVPLPSPPSLVGVLSPLPLISSFCTSFYDNHGRCMLSTNSQSRFPACLSSLILIFVPTYEQPIDFDGDVNLFHFVLLRCVGKGAFGKVRTYLLSSRARISFQPSLFVFPGPRRPAQADTRFVRTQVHQQIQMREDESGGEYYSGTQVAGGGALMRALSCLLPI